MMIVFRRRLFWKVYLALLLSLITVAVLIGGLMWLIGEAPREIRVPGRLHLEDLAIPEQDGRAGAIAAALERLGHELGGDVSLYDAHGALIASRGRPIKLATHEAYEPAFAPRILRIDLADGRAVLARPGRPMPSQRRRMLTIVLIVVGGVGLAAFPITARLTRRLEGLRSGVERWGAGALWTRVDVVGDDEVAVVARTFNAAAERVEALLKSQKALLANASHELRSPLARLRVAIELWLDRPDSKIYEEIARNITEIDQLSEEILLASRLDDRARRRRRSSRARSRGGGARRRQFRRRADRREPGRDPGRRGAASPSRSQSAGKRIQAWTSTGLHFAGASRRGGAHRRLRPRARDRAFRA